MRSSPRLPPTCHTPSAGIAASCSSSAGSARRELRRVDAAASGPARRLAGLATRLLVGGAFLAVAAFARGRGLLGCSLRLTAAFSPVSGSAASATAIACADETASSRTTSLGSRPTLDPLERRLANAAVAGPAAELGADHELGPDPGDAVEVAAPATAVVLRRRRVERRRVGHERRHRRQQPLPGRGGEARADLAREPQLIALVDADRDGAEIAGVAFARRPATDDELLLGPDLELQPGRRPLAGLVARAAELGDDPFEAAGLGRGHERLALADDVRREPDPVRLAQDAPEQPLAILERDVEQRAPVEVEQVEHLVHERALRGAGAGRGCPPPRRWLIRSWSSEKSGRPSSSSATTSPSTIASSASIQVGGERRFGKYVSASLRLRVQSFALPSRTTAWTR